MHERKRIAFYCRFFLSLFLSLLSLCLKFPFIVLAAAAAAMSATKTVCGLLIAAAVWQFVMLFRFSHVIQSIFCALLLPFDIKKRRRNDCTFNSLEKCAHRRRSLAINEIVINSIIFSLLHVNVIQLFANRDAIVLSGKKFLRLRKTRRMLCCFLQEKNDWISLGCVRCVAVLQQSVDDACDELVVVVCFRIEGKMAHYSIKV